MKALRWQRAGNKLVNESKAECDRLQSANNAESRKCRIEFVADKIQVSLLSTSQIPGFSLLTSHPGPAAGLISCRPSNLQVASNQLIS